MWVLFELELPPIVHHPRSKGERPNERLPSLSSENAATVGVQEPP